MLMHSKVISFPTQVLLYYLHSNNRKKFLIYKKMEVYKRKVFNPSIYSIISSRSVGGSKRPKVAFESCLKELQATLRSYLLSLGGDPGGMSSLKLDLVRSGISALEKPHVLLDIASCIDVDANLWLSLARRGELRKAGLPNDWTTYSAILGMTMGAKGGVPPVASE